MMNRMEIHDRLKSAIYDHWQPASGRPSLRNFHRTLAAAHSDDPGTTTSYSAIQKYVAGETEPSISFLEAAASILQVRPVWLMAGEGSPTKVTELARVKADLRSISGSWWEDSAQDLVVNWSAGSDRRSDDRRHAILRFGRKLADAEFASADWFYPERREELIREAMDFLVLVDGFFKGPESAQAEPPGAESTAEQRREALDERMRLSDRHQLIIAESESKSWYVTWADEVLALFSLRVQGLGIRTDGLEDSHFPIASRRGSPRSEAS